MPNTNGKRYIGGQVSTQLDCDVIPLAKSEMTPLSNTLIRKIVSKPSEMKRCEIWLIREYITLNTMVKDRRTLRNHAG